MLPETVGQLLPHDPQFCSSVFGFTQVLVLVHQSWVLVQAFSQVPMPSQNLPVPQLVVAPA